MDLRNVCVCKFLNVVVTVGLMVSDEVAEAGAQPAIVQSGLYVGLWMVYCRWKMLDSHCSAQGGESLGDGLWTVIGQDDAGKPVGHNKIVHECLGTL